MSVILLSHLQHYDLAITGDSSSGKKCDCSVKELPERPIQLFHRKHSSTNSSHLKIIRITASKILSSIFPTILTCYIRMLTHLNQVPPLKDLLYTKFPLLSKFQPCFSTLRLYQIYGGVVLPYCTNNKLSFVLSTDYIMLVLFRE